jgi:7-carboxy-7-deazaguanine synthase
MTTPDTLPPPAHPGALAQVRRYPVTEIFGPTIQGEGEVIGLPTLFVRLFGCDYRCTWCDSPHAVLPEHAKAAERLAVVDILARLTALQPAALVTLSGGNPALFDLTPLIDGGRAQGFTFACETQGTRWPRWFRRLRHLILSPKPPSSGETPDLAAMAQDLEAFMAGRHYVHPTVSLKVPIFDLADLAFADQVRMRLGPLADAPLTLSVGNPLYPGSKGGDLATQAELETTLLAHYQWLAAEVLKRGWPNVRVLPQLHVLAWGNRRGV